MKSLFKIYILINLICFGLSDFITIEYSIYSFFNIILFYMFTKLPIAKNNFVFSIFYISFIFAYVVKLQLYQIYYPKVYLKNVTLEVYGLTTMSNAIIVFTMVSLSIFHEARGIPKKFAYSGIIRRKESLILKLSFIIVLVTSYVYFKLGLFIMGKEMVELPFHLNGLMFYMRTMIIPIVLLTVLFTTKFNINEKYVIIILFFLGVSDMFLRGSKGALIYLLIQIIIVLSIKRSAINKSVNFKPYLIVALLLIIIYPLMKSYRGVLTGEQNNDHKEFFIKEAFIEGSESILNRLLGFSEFYNVYNHMRTTERSYNYDKSISDLYTHDLLNLPQGFHLSSPSLLGAGYMLGNINGVYALTFLYVCGIFVISVFFLRTLKVILIPVIAYFIFEIINSTIAGTVDFTLGRLIILFVFAYLLDRFVLK